MADKINLDRIDDYKYRISHEENENMKVDGLIFSNEVLMNTILKDNSLQQVINVASLPGIVRNSLAMPDIHWGYGFPIGGVAATDIEEGVISPGGVGYDINCGVRLLKTSLKYEDIHGNIKSLADALYRNVPSGLGSKGKVKINEKKLDEVLEYGARWTVENGYGYDDDLNRIEESGCMEGANTELISTKAKKRGMPQLGSLGAGNHFLEIQKVGDIMDIDGAKNYGINELDQIVVMIHTGSRGCGYQICQDQINSMSKSYRRDGNYFVSDEYNIRLPDRQLVCSPIQSQNGQNYFSAMKCAANYAWANRQMITHWVRESFFEVLKDNFDLESMQIIYDVTHNIAKMERYDVDGERRYLMVHRKGATRSLGKNNPHIPKKYRQQGQPVIIPGDMGNGSYLLKGTDEAERTTFGSTCHGAGRISSRSAARKAFKGEKVIEDLGEKGIYVKAHSAKVAAEEAPQVYKDIEEVVNVTHGAGISLKVCRMDPLAVIKG